MYTIFLTLFFKYVVKKREYNLVWKNIYNLIKPNTLNKNVKPIKTIDNHVFSTFISIKRSSCHFLSF